MLKSFFSFRTRYPVVISLGIISFFTDVASEMLYPITPIFLTQLGTSISFLGFIEGFAQGLSSLLQIYFGVWSDRIGHRRPFILVGYFLSTISRPLIGLAHNPFHVLFARTLDRSGKGIRTAPRDALLADMVEISHRGEAFGWHRAIDTLGAVVGPLIGILLLSFFSGNLRMIYIWSLVPGLISFVLIFAIKENKSTPVRTIFSFSDFRLMSREFKLYLLVWTLFTLSNSSDVFILLRAKDMGMDLTQVILLYAFFNLTYALASPYFGKLGDKIGLVKVLGMGWIVFSLVYLGFAHAKSATDFYTLFGIYGIFMAMTEGIGKSIISTLAPPHLKASALGLLGTVTGLSAIIASTLAGIIWEHFSPEGTFYFGAIGSAIAVFFLFRFRKQIKVS